MNKFTSIFKIEIDKTRVYGLDIIRCLAIIIVVYVHSMDLLPNSTVKSFFLTFFAFPDGVAVFFVLSGFLIGGILIKVLEKERHSFKTLLSFWKHRWLRTLPTYFFILSIIISLSIFLGNDLKISNVFRYFIFSQNVFTPHPPFFTEAWSLSIEEWFYLLIPFLIFCCVGILRITPKESVLIMIVTIIVFTVIVRYYRYVTIPVSSVEVWGAIFRGQVITRLDNLMIGVLGAYLSFYHKADWIKYKNEFLIAGIILIVLTSYIPKFYFPTSAFYWCNLSFIFTAIAILLTFPWLSQLQNGSGIVYKFVTYTSLISYSMYLIHGALILHLILARIRILQAPGITIVATRYLLYWIIVYACSVLLHKYFEKPIMRMRGKLK